MSRNGVPGSPGSAGFIAAFLIGALLFSYPLLALFNVHASVFGVPLLYAYLFVAWGLLIALIRRAARQAR